MITGPRAERSEAWRSTTFETWGLSICGSPQVCVGGSDKRLSPLLLEESSQPPSRFVVSQVSLPPVKTNSKELSQELRLIAIKRLGTNKPSVDSRRQANGEQIQTSKPTFDSSVAQCCIVHHPLSRA